MIEVTQADRELFIYLLGFDAVEDEQQLPRIRNGEFDQWAKMKKIARHRIAARNAALEEAARVAYVACAETRHVSLGGKCSDVIHALKEQP